MGGGSRGDRGGQIQGDHGGQLTRFNKEGAGITPIFQICARNC